MGTLEFIIITFAGNQFNGDIMPALRETVERHDVRVVDLVVVRKDADGQVRGMDLNTLPDLVEPWNAPPIDANTGMLTPDDVERIGGRLEPNSTAALLLYEHVWAERLQAAVTRAHGQVRFLERISPEDQTPATFR